MYFTKYTQAVFDCELFHVSISFYLRTHIKQSHKNCMAFLLTDVPNLLAQLSTDANRFAVVAYISIINSAYTNQWTTESQLDNS